MDTRTRAALSAPMSRWVVGGVLVLGAAVVLLAVEAAILPTQLAGATDGYQAIQPAWPMLGTLVLAACGLAAVVHGRARQREERRYAVRVARAHRLHRDPAEQGVSPGVAGTPRLPRD